MVASSRVVPTLPRSTRVLCAVSPPRHAAPTSPADQGSAWQGLCPSWMAGCLQRSLGMRCAIFQLLQHRGMPRGGRGQCGMCHRQSLTLTTITVLRVTVSCSFPCRVSPREGGRGWMVGTRTECRVTHTSKDRNRPPYRSGLPNKMGGPQVPGLWPREAPYWLRVCVSCRPRAGLNLPSWNSAGDLTLPRSPRAPMVKVLLPQRGS